MAQTGIRSYLNDNGYTNDQITYNNGNVLLNGKNFYSATPQQTNDPKLGLVKGSTYGDPTALATALNTYRGTQVATNPNQSAIRSTLMDTTLGNIGKTANATPFQFNAPEKFSYDAATDPQYQAALNLAKGNIQTGQNNTLASLVAHGQGDSSYSAGVTQGIANKEMANVSNNILPQLIQQAYQHYQDGINNDYRTQAANYGASQDQFGNQSSLASILSGLDQQDFSQGMQTKQYDQGVKNDSFAQALQTSETAYNHARDSLLDKRYETEFKNNVQQQGFENAIKTALQQHQISNDNAQLAISQQNANTSSASQSNSATSANNSNNNARINQLMDAWKATGKAPAGLEGLGVNKGTPYAGQEVGPSATEDKQNQQSEYVSGFDSLKPEQRKLAFKNDKATIIKDLGIAGYNSLYSMYFDSSGYPLDEN